MKTTTFLIFIAGFICLTSTLYASSKVVDLSGDWRFESDPNDIGLRESWFNKRLQKKIQLPGTTYDAEIGDAEQDPNPGYLSRLHKYIGVAWYQKDIEIPNSWRGCNVDLFLERVMWESRVWINEIPQGEQDSLGTAHIHPLGNLKPGKHRLTIRIDNRMIHPIGDRGHCYTEFTQIKWNGVVGAIELRSYDQVRLNLARIFTDIKANKVIIEATIGNSGKAWNGALEIDIKNPAGKTAAKKTIEVAVAQNGSVIIKPEATLTKKPLLWDEFTPNLYTVNLRLSGKDVNEEQIIKFGFRTLKASGNKLLVNGRPTFLRGNLDCAQYPDSGHPPMSTKDWKRTFSICKDYGINHIRFHSWCPPEEAFIAADQMGVYLLAEVLWIDWWMGKPNRKDMNTPGYPKGVGKNDRTIDKYVRKEMRSMFNQYGNHPSFALFAIGNELGSSDFKVMGEWIHEEKLRDPRRLYAASTARTITPFDDFSDTHNIPGVGSVVNHLGIANTDWDYEHSYSRASLPIIAHEMGQMPVYPNWNEIKKYRGPVRAKNFTLFRKQAVENGIESQSADFQRASGALQRIIYKNEMEAQLRSPSCAGVSWLSMQDFPGQGEALVGWLDTFYDSKGLVTPAEFRCYSAPTVLLARFKKFVWEDNESFHAKVQISHWGSKRLLNTSVEWSLKERGHILKKGIFEQKEVPVGSVQTVGEINYDLNDITTPTRLTLRVQIKGESTYNNWHIWVFAKNQTQPEPETVVVTSSPHKAWKSIKKGRVVLLSAHRSGSTQNAAWMPLFWSARFFPGQNRKTLGALIRADHPAFNLFPTGSHLDWQWKTICANGRGFVLNDLPANYRPIVQPISDYHFNDKLGTIFEFKTKEGGRLLICGYNIIDNLNKNPAVRQLRKSLIAYLTGDKFNPQTEISEHRFNKYFPVLNDAPVVKAPLRFQDALLYVKAGVNHPGSGNAQWHYEIDSATIKDGFSYKVTCDAVWKDGTGCAWWAAKSLKIEIKCDKPALYDLYVHFHDWNNNGRRGQIKFEGRTFELGPHTGKGNWVKLNVMREDALDGKLILEAKKTSGPNLQITAIALVPQ